MIVILAIDLAPSYQSDPRTRMKSYDAIIIGSGQGGSPLAHKLADLGWSVALVEREHLGGSCVNYGCTPTKTMVAHARVAHVVRRSQKYGVHAGDTEVDLGAIVARKNRVVAQWRHGQEQHAEKRPKLDVIRAHARFTGPKTIRAGDNEIAGEHIFINTGTRPRIPTISGVDDIDVLTNRSILDLTEIPPHLLVLGGSYVGLEFGQMFRRFGSDVTIIEHNERIISREDAEVSEALREALEAEGISFCMGATARSVKRVGESIELIITREDGSTDVLSGSHLLVAAGRLPNTDDLGLDHAGVKTDCSGYIEVNDRLETSVEGIWALGDVKGGPAFTHISYDDHLVIYDNLIESENRSIDGRIVPYALFTDPELGRVGMTEQQAVDAGYTIKVGRIPMSRVARAIERDETAGLMKVVIDAETDRILGAAILGTEGGELVQILMALMMADAPWTLLRRSIYIHPTLAEGFFALMESVELREGGS